MPASYARDLVDGSATGLIPLTLVHWPAVAEIYAAGIAGAHATFETEPPSWESFDAGKLDQHRFVAIRGSRVVGWTAVAPTSSRAVYAGVVEHSVFVDPAHQGGGVGRALLERLIASTESAGIWTLQSAIFPENTGSLSLHHSLGFRDIGVRRRVGQMRSGPLAGQWRDVVLVERRREVVGRRNTK
ncbi:MAG: N-acetyltransferase family protein [Nocardioidaceae bacterium]